jgi:hypothetical protein
MTTDSRRDVGVCLLKMQLFTPSRLVHYLDIAPIRRLLSSDYVWR